MTVYFAIAYVGRSGSSYLESLLDSHPDAQCKGEIFWSSDLTSGHKNLRDIVIDEVHSTVKPASGFKYGNLHIIKYPYARDILKEFGYRIVWLTRKNRIDQYISMQLAKLNNCWRSDYGNIDVASFRANIADMDRYIRKFEIHDQIISQFADTFQMKKVYYEDLVAPEGYLSTLDFLELERTQLRSRFKKQRNGSQKDILVNFEEVAAHYAHTPHCKYLDA